MNVLVAEDNPVNRKIICAQLSQLGCRLCGGGRRRGGPRGAAAGPTAPDVILMDCHMPKLDGWETTRRIRCWASSAHPAERRASSIPIVALTASVYPEERIRCREAGMSGFVAKPVKLAELQQALLDHRPVR